MIKEYSHHKELPAPHAVLIQSMPEILDTLNHIGMLTKNYKILYERRSDELALAMAQDAQMLNYKVDMSSIVSKFLLDLDKTLDDFETLLKANLIEHGLQDKYTEASILA